MLLAELFLIEASQRFKYWFNLKTNESLIVSENVDVSTYSKALHHTQYIKKYPEAFDLSVDDWEKFDIDNYLASIVQWDLIDEMLTRGWVRVSITIGTQITIDLNSQTVADALVAARYYSKEYYPDVIIVDYFRDNTFSLTHNDIKNFLKRGVVPK